MYAVEDIKKIVKPLAKAYGINKVSLFGSYARGEANEKSDIDLYIEKGELRSLIQYFSFVQELEKKFGCHVDVVTTEISDKEFLGHIFSEGVLIYDKQQENNTENDRLLSGY